MIISHMDEHSDVIAIFKIKKIFGKMIAPEKR
jgi:hypothetical protein